MSKILTTYNRPSLLASIEACEDFPALRRLRDALTLGIRLRKIEANTDTIRRWEKACWQKVILFMTQAATIEQLSSIRNTVMFWEPPEVIEEIYHNLRSHHPSPLARLATYGITVEGVSNLHQCATAHGIRTKLREDYPDMAVKIFGKET